MSHVYVIEAVGGPVKVGITNSPEKRLAALRTGTPFPLHLAYVEKVLPESARAIERAAHQSLAAYHVHGEWFDTTVTNARNAVAEAAANTAVAAAAQAVGRPLRLAIPQMGMRPREKILLETGLQLKAGRLLIGMEQIDLAECSHLSVNTIRKMEAAGKAPITARVRNIQIVQDALEKAGVVFLNDENGIGAQLAGKPDAQSLMAT